MTNVRHSTAIGVVIATGLLVALAVRQPTDQPLGVKLKRPDWNGAAAPAAGPRYRFQVGDAYVYEATSTFEYEGGTMINTDRDDVWVIRQNDDGSSRLVIRHTSQYRQERKGSDPYEGQERVTICYCDISPDGQYERNSSLGFQVNPSAIFPRLPHDSEELTSGSYSAGDAFQGETAFELIERPSQPHGPWTIKYVRTTPMDAIYDSTESGEWTFDGELGLVRTLTTASSQGYGFVGEGHGTITLVSAETVRPDWLSRFIAETDVYFEASSEYTRLLQDASHDYRRAKELMAQAKTVLDQAITKVTLPVVTTQLQKQLEQHEQSASDTLENAELFAKLIGQPSEHWALADLDGVEHPLSEYRGRVVLLDFWYRGCGWCIRAMPQINQVADTFADRPVTVLGMNTDQDVEDARFVVEAMKLSYNNLQASGIPEKYGVTGFPTLVILDQRGTIRDIHVGYAEDLFDRISATVERLLAEATPEDSDAEVETGL